MKAPYTLDDTIDIVESNLLALDIMPTIVERERIKLLQSVLHHLKEIQKAHSNGGTCDYIVTMNKEQYRRFCKQIMPADIR